MTTKKETTKKQITKKTCIKCGKEQNATNYYSTSDIDFFPDGKIHVCKNCCESIIEEKGFEGFQSLMRLINKPIYDDLYKGSNGAGDYVRQMNSLPQYKNNVYNDSTLFNEPKSISNSKVNKIKAKELSEEELQDLIDFFGEGYEEKDYIYLISEYEDYLNRYEVDSKTLENLIKEICLTQLDIRKKRANGEKVDQQQKTLQDLLGSSNLKPVQENSSSSLEQVETFGTLIKKFENEHPIPEPHESWKDVDGIGKYIRTFFLGHLTRVFGKENPYQDEYNEVIEEFTVRPPKRDGDD